MGGAGVIENLHFPIVQVNIMGGWTGDRGITSTGVGGCGDQTPRAGNCLPPGCVVLPQG